MNLLKLIKEEYNNTIINDLDFNIIYGYIMYYSNPDLFIKKLKKIPLLNTKLYNYE